MRRKKAKAGASVGLSSVVGWKNKGIEGTIDSFEKAMKRLAKKNKLQIDVYITVWEV